MPSASASAASIGGSTRSTPSGMSATPSALRSARDLAGGGPEEAGVRGDGAAQSDHAGVDVLLAQPRAVEPVVLGGRAEVPDVRIAAAGQQRVAGHLVAGPLADVGARDVADVVEVEEQDARRPPRRRAPRGRVPAGRCAADRRSSAPPSRHSSSPGTGRIVGIDRYPSDNGGIGGLPERRTGRSFTPCYTPAPWLQPASRSCEFRGGRVPTRAVCQSGKPTICNVA